MKFSDPISATQAAQRLGVTTQRIRQLCASGELVACQIGREWLISRKSVENRRKNPAKIGRPSKQET